MNASPESRKPVPKWKGGSDQSPFSAGGAPGKWTATIVTLLLVGLLSWLVASLWPSPPGKMIWAGLRIEARGSGGGADLSPAMRQALLGDRGDGEATMSDNEVPDWSALQGSAIDAGTRLRGHIKTATDQFSNRDTFVLYVSARGFTQQGKAYLELSDSSAPATGHNDEVDGDTIKGAIALTKILEAFQDSRVGCKLLVLDVIPTDFDPSRGILFNEFPACAAAAVKEEQDENLWVLLSHRDYQTTGEFASYKPTLLDALIVRALRGEAAHEESQFLGLKDLYEFVVARSKTLFQDQPAEAVVPVLLRGKHGKVHDDEISGLPDPRLARLDLPVEDEDAAAETKGERASKRTKAAAQRKAKNAANRAKRSVVPSNLRVPRLAGPILASLVQEPDEAKEPAKDIATPDSSDAAKSIEKGAEAASAKTASASKKPAVKTAVAADASADVAKAKGSAVGDDAAADGGSANALFEMWTVWGNLQEPNRGFWGPVDACPHRWRLVNVKLLQKAKDWREDASPQEQTRKEQTGEIRGITKDLGKLLTYMKDLSSGAGSQPPAFNSVCNVDLSDIAKDGQKAKWPAHDATTEASYKVRDKAIRFHNFAFFILPDYILWQARSPRGLAGGPDSPFDKRARDVRRFVTSLAGLRATLASLEGQPLDSTAKLESHLGALKGCLETLEQDVAVDDVRLATKQWKDLAGEKRTGRLLDSPLLTAVTRRLLLAHWCQRQAASQASGNGQLIAGENGDDRSSHTDDLNTVHLDEINTEQLDELIAIQRQVIEWLDPTAWKEIQPQYDALDAGDDDRRIQYRKLGSALSSCFYQKLPQILDESGDEKNRIARREKLGLLRFVDVGDVERWGDRSFPMWSEFVIEAKRRTPVLTLKDDQQPVPLQLDQWIPIDIRYQTTALSGPISATVKFDPDVVAVKRADGDQMVPCANETSFKWMNDASGDGEHHSRLFVKAIRARSGGAVETHQVTLTLHSESVADGPSRTLLCELPRPDRIDLIVQKVGSTEPERNEHWETGEMLALRSLPNRDTGYEFFLVNRGAAEKTLIVKLFSIPETDGQTWAPGRLRAHDNLLATQVKQTVFVGSDPKNGVRSDFEAKYLLKAVEKTIAPGDGKVRLSFSSEPKEAAAAEGEASKPTGAAGSTSGRDVSYGMLCWIADKSDPKRFWVKWIELPVLHPREYVSVQPPKFQGTEISIDAALRQDSGLSWGADDSVKVSWDGVTVDLTRKTPALPLPQGGFVADEKKKRIYLDVDGYPRAFAFDIVPREPNDRSTVHPWREQLADIRITSVTARFDAPEVPGTKPIQADTRTISSGNATLAFQQCGELSVQIAADVPTNMFSGDYGASQYVSLKVDGRRRGGPYYADRDVKTSLVSLGEVVTLHTEVSDFSVSIRPGPNTTVALVASLPPSLNNESPARVNVHIDSKSPELVIDQKSYEVGPNQPATLNVTLSDRGSGVDRLLFGVVDDPRNVDEEGLKKRDIGGAPKRQNLSVRLDTVDLGLEKDKTYVIFLRAYDLAGNSIERTCKLRLRPPPPVRSDGDIVGTVSYGPRLISGVSWKIKITGPYSKVVSHGEEQDGGKASFKNGHFKFKNLEPGSYTITVEGVPGGKSIKSVPEPVTVTAGKATNVDIQKFE